MARQQHKILASQPEIKITLFKKQTLGRGAYGVVCRAKYGELPCAAKLLQAVFFEDGDPAAQNMVEKFREECQRLSALKHPNVIQYLDSHVDPDSGLPVLLMEELDESLTSLLARSSPSLPFKTQVSICNDVALALSYLHSYGIIHRDLSSNNVLLLADRRAKVTDFGMSRLDRSTAQTRRGLTQCPGCMVYMPPEALKEVPTYSSKLDVFSFGVLVIQILTRNFPNPGPAMREVKVEGSPHFPAGVVHVSVAEVERRRADIEAVDPAHPLRALALPCLGEREDSRPSTQELCVQISNLKGQTFGSGTQEGTAAKEVEVDLRAVNKQLTESLKRAEDALRAKDETIKKMEGELKAMRAQQSEEGTLVRDMSRTRLGEKQELERQLRDAKAQDRDQAAAAHSLFRHNSSPLPSKATVSNASVKGSAPPLLRVSSSPKQRAPESGLGKGVLATDGRKCYFATFSSNSVFSYSIHGNTWERLPDYPYVSPGLAIVRGMLTGLGGVVKTAQGDGTPQATNTLYSLVNGIWVEMVPNMPSKQYSPTSVCTKSLLVVAGGLSPGVTLRQLALDMLNTITYRWSTVLCPLAPPRNISEVSMALSEPEGKLYITGGCEVMEYSLKALQLPPADVQSRAISEPPVKWGSITTLQGQLVSVGGYNADAPVSSIHAYSVEKSTWYLIGELVSPRFQPVVVPVSSNSIMVVSGSNMTVQDIEIVENLGKSSAVSAVSH